MSSHLLFCLPFLLFPCIVLCRIVFAKPQDLEIWPNQLTFRALTKVRSSSYFPMAAWIFLQTSSLVTWSLYVSSQRPVSFSLALPSKSMTHRRTLILICKGSASVSPMIQEICRYRAILASAVSKQQWLVQSFRPSPVLSLHLKQLLQDT